MGEEIRVGNRDFARALSDRAGRFDLAQDYGVGERSRRGEFFLSDKLRDFFRSWLGYAEVETVFKDRPEATSRFDDGGTSVYRPILSAWNNAIGGYYGDEPTLIQLLDDSIARVVIEDRDVLRQLLTTRQFYLFIRIKSLRRCERLWFSLRHRHRGITDSRHSTSPLDRVAR